MLTSTYAASLSLPHLCDKDFALRVVQRAAWHFWTVIGSDAEAMRVGVEALEEEPIPPPARTDPAIMSRIAALEGGRREERTPVEDDGDDDEECGHRHRRMRLWEPHY